MAVIKGLPTSVQVRLVRHAKATRLDPNLVLQRFATERFLYRLSCSEYADRFVLKGALLLLVWLGETIRPTRDAGLLGYGDLSGRPLKQVFTELCSIDVEPDGLEYSASSVRVARIRAEDAYGGMRVTLSAQLGNARLRVQVDVGIGDSVYPEPELLDYPGLLDLPMPRLRAYRPETVVAEKLHAMVVLGEANSRMRDFFDLDVLAQRMSFEADPLDRALRATFERRRTPIPEALPLALTPAFAALRGKPEQWSAFLRKNGLKFAPLELNVAVSRIATFLESLIAAARNDASVARSWAPGGPWEERS